MALLNGSASLFLCPFSPLETYICLASQFKCNRKQKCIPLNLRCNGQDDCGDGEDETDCRESFQFIVLQMSILSSWTEKLTSMLPFQGLYRTLKRSLRDVLYNSGIRWITLDVFIRHGWFVSVCGQTTWCVFLQYIPLNMYSKSIRCYSLAWKGITITVRKRTKILCCDVTHQNITPPLSLSDCWICLASYCERGEKKERQSREERRKSTRQDLLKLYLMVKANYFILSQSCSVIGCGFWRSVLMKQRRWN